MENYKNINQNQYLIPNINNDNNNTILNVENIINHNKKHNIKERPNKIFKKRNNFHKINFEPSLIKENNLINETNPNLNENFGNFINKNIFINDNNNNNNANIPGIFGGNDNNHNNQLNDLNKMRRNETFVVNKENSFKYDDILKEDKKINKLPERKSLNRIRHNKNCKSNLNIGIIDKNKKISNLKHNIIKLEKRNINKINSHKKSINKNNNNNNLEKNAIKIEKENIINITLQSNRINKNENENQYKIPQFNQSRSNENRKEKEIIPFYYKNLYRKYKEIFGDINIFNSILIMLNNIQDVDIHLSKTSKREEQIEILKNNNIVYSLVSILYHANQYINKKENIHSKDIFNKYTEFTNYFSKLNYRQNDKFLFDINNLEYILEFIYYEINFEFTLANNNKKTNNINNYYNTNNNNYFDVFKRNNRSMISDMFTGFYQYNNNSLNSQLNLYNGQNYNFKSFSFIKFNLDEVNQFYDSINISEMNLNNFYSNINLYSCFDYTFKDKIHSIYSLPKILTVVLSQTDKINFILHHEINLKEYTNKFSNNNDSSYLLISIFCQMSYNKKFINYIFDPKKESWFSLSDQEIREVDSIDINAIPLILIYKLKNTFEHVYKEIKIKDKLCTITNFQGGMFQTTQLFFDQRDKIKDVRNKIKSWFNIKESFTLLINGCLAKDFEFLSKVLEKGYNILVILKSN